MVKKNNSWLLWVVLIVAVVAIILSAIAISKSNNITGNSIFDFFKKSSISTNTQTQSKGLLADAYLASGKSSESLKNYEAVYDENGELIYELLDDATYFNIGNTYELIEDNNGVFLKSKITGLMVPGPDPADCKPRCTTNDICTPNGLYCNTPITCKETQKKNHCRWPSKLGGESSID
ncbi:MAG: hypothetical protein WC812_04655 [Candidatus Pacearchaeota archaeon]|jgi:hypothetical protein